MRVKDFAPHLSGRMLPGLFSCDLKIGQRERFPGDPWPHFPHSPTWFWMHATGCDAGLYRARPIARQPFPADLDALFASLPAASPSQPRPAAMQAVLFPETA
jgi:hypothetical protein